VKGDEFIHILTRVVNSKVGPRFLELVHDMRELLEKAGIAEEAESRIEPGKPIRQRAPEDIARRQRPSVGRATPEGEGPTPGAGAAVQSAEPGAQPGPDAPALPAGGSESAPAGSPTGEDALDFIQLGPNRFVRKSEAASLGETPWSPAAEPDAPPSAPDASPSAADAQPPVTDALPPAPASGPPPVAADPAPLWTLKVDKKAKKETVRSIVLSSLKDGDLTMDELQEAVKKEKGQFATERQMLLALKKVDARKRAGGQYTISSREEPGDQLIEVLEPAGLVAEEPAAAPEGAEGTASPEERSGGGDDPEAAGEAPAF
jgi:hypothetical protein